MMPKPDYIATLEWMRDNHADFVPSEGEGFPAHFLGLDGNWWMLEDIEECETFDEVRDVVTGVTV